MELDETETALETPGRDAGRSFGSESGSAVARRELKKRVFEPRSGGRQ